VGRNVHIIEEQLRGVLRLEANLVEQAPNAEAGAILGLNKHQKNAAHPLSKINLAYDNNQLGEIAVRDKSLRAVERVLVTMPFGARANRLQVGASPGLDHRDRANKLALRHARQITPLLLLGAVVQKVMRGDDVHADAHAEQRAARHLLMQ